MILLLNYNIALSLKWQVLKTYMVLLGTYMYVYSMIIVVYIKPTFL
jgi:hypothetical protein